MTADEAKLTICPLFAIARGADSAKCLADKCQWWTWIGNTGSGRCAGVVLAHMAIAILPRGDEPNQDGAP